MAVNVVMPKLGLTMVSGKIVEWKKNEGEQINEKEIVMVIETEKVTYEVESPGTGILHIIVAPDVEAPVSDVVGVLAESKEEYDKIVAGGAPVTAAAPAPAPAAAPAGGAPAAAPAVETTAGPGERVKISPLAKKIAEESKLDITKIKGTGPGGRIVREDVNKYTEQAKAAPATAPAAAPAAPAEGDRLVKLTGMRKVIARKMLESKVQAAQAYMSNTVDATKIQEYRQVLMPYIEKKSGVRITVTDLMMKITGAAIAAHPVINTRWTDEGVLWIKDVHMGMAMALDDGLIVPVIRDINQKTMTQIAKDRVALIDKGRKGKLTPDEMKGSTFTLSAMGMFGIEQFIAIINQPENAILGVAAIIDKPVVMNGQIVIRPMMNVMLTYDHRTIDGAKAGLFMVTLKSFIENPIMVIA
ncbi:MAG: dihydrolipoamide acetyltransferase family protein [Proteobacteria bacterium]|nr:dihydrolipoamide acetyltransferase family protein [Pseudomonadota bacterium]